MKPHSAMHLFETLRQLADQHWMSAPDDKAYVLVDGAFFPSLYPDFKANWPQQACISLYGDFPEGASPEYTPFVFEMNSAWLQHPATSQWLYKPDNPALGRIILIWTSQTLTALSGHLTQHVRALAPQGRVAYLRIQDADVLPCALECMEQVQRDHFLAPLHMLCWTDLDHRWFKLSGAAGQIPQAQQTVWPWTESQTRRLARALLPRKILMHLEQEHAERMTGSREGWRTLIRKWVEKATAKGIEEAAEVQLYCTLALTTGEDFMDAPAVMRCIEQADAHAPAQSFMQAMAAVPADVWDQLAAKQKARNPVTHPMDEL